MSLPSIFPISTQCFMGFLLMKVIIIIIPSRNRHPFFHPYPRQIFSSASDRNSPPLLETTTVQHHHTHSLSHSLQQHSAIAPHDLPPLHVADINWHGASLARTLPSTTTSSSFSSSSAFPSPSPPLPASTTGNTKSELEGYEMGMDVHGGAGVC